MDDAPIRAAGLSKVFGAVRALDRLELEVPRGVMYGFLGPNGSGKTTTIRLLLGLTRPTGGEVRVFGQDPWSLDPKVRGRIGFLPGELGFYDEMTGLRFLDYLGGMTGFDADYRSLILDRLDLGNGDLRRRIGHYSRGMKQKLALVQAFQHRPELIIMDEPTTGLDPLVQLALFEILEEARRDGATIFFSSHVLSDVERLCDRIGLIRAGRLATETTVAELHQSAARRVLVAFKKRTPEHLDQVPGVASAERAGDGWSLRVQGDLSPLLAAIAGFELADIVIEPVRLEDVFVAMYRNS